MQHDVTVYAMSSFNMVPGTRSPKTDVRTPQTDETGWIALAQELGRDAQVQYDAPKVLSWFIQGGAPVR